MSRATCRHSSRVGTTTRACGAPSAPSATERIRSSSGMPKPSVLPVPVGACPIRSVPRMAMGMAYSWIAKARRMPTSASASTVSGRAPSSAKVGLSGRTGAVAASSAAAWLGSIVIEFGVVLLPVRPEVSTRAPMDVARATRGSRSTGRTRGAGAVGTRVPTYGTCQAADLGNACDLRPGPTPPGARRRSSGAARPGAAKLDSLRSCPRPIRRRRPPWSICSPCSRTANFRLSTRWRPMPGSPRTCTGVPS